MTTSNTANTLGRDDPHWIPFWVNYSAFDPASVIDLLEESTRESNCADARKLAWIATRHDQIHNEWAAAESTLAPQSQHRRFTDELCQLRAEVGAAIGRGSTAADTLIELALNLRYRLPHVFELHYEGLISQMHASVIAERCAAVTDSKQVHQYDRIITRLLAEKMARGRAVLTRNDIARLADGVLAKLDPDAIVPPRIARRRGIEFFHRHDGLVEIAALMFPEAATYLADEIDRIADTVCKHDPRKIGERRVDALIAMVEGYSTLGCQCETDNCDHPIRVPKHATLEAKTTADVTVVINESTLLGADDDPAEVDGQILPAHAVRDLIARVTEAWFRPLGKVLHNVADSTMTICAHHRAGYQPSELQVRFLKARYGKCVFPGCDVPFAKCQIDHVTERNHHDPRAGGQTVIGNLLPLCGRHHRCKTEQNWISLILADGTVEWHTPTGHTYRTALVQGDMLFPDLDLIDWLDPIRPLKDPPETTGGPTAAEARNDRREALRRQYRREREKLAEDHPNNPLYSLEPPPF